MAAGSAIERFLRARSFAVIGASSDRSKYGNKVLRCYLQHGKDVRAVNPHETSIEGVLAVPRLADLSPAPEAISIITPPRVTERIVDEAAALGIRQVWIQPGAESSVAIARAEAACMNVIASGPCLLVVLGYRE